MSPFVKQFRVSKDLTKQSAILVQSKDHARECLLIDAECELRLFHKTQQLDQQVDGQQFLFDCYGLLDVCNVSASGTRTWLAVWVTECTSVGVIQSVYGRAEVFAITDVRVTAPSASHVDHSHHYSAVKSIRSGSLYFASPATGAFDLTVCAQKFSRSRPTLPDIRFLWNRNLYLNMRASNVTPDRWMLMVICGSVAIESIATLNGQVNLCLISRVACERMATAFNTTGVNDDGLVADLVETEQLIYTGGTSADCLSSFLLLAGSVPIFWERNIDGISKVRLTRGKECTQPAFDRHFAILQYLYGKQVVINLLGTIPEEENLSSMYRLHHSRSVFKDAIGWLDYDYNRYCAKGEISLEMDFRKQMEHHLCQLSTFHCTIQQQSTSVLSNPLAIDTEQKGTFRVNCLDGLRRTARVQAFIGRLAFEQQLLKLFPTLLDPLVKGQLIGLLPQMWQRNQRQVSLVLSSVSTSQCTSKDFISLAKLNRYTCLLPPQIDFLLPEPMSDQLVESFCDYTMPRHIGIAVATWNIKVDGRGTAWQWKVKWNHTKIDLFAVAIQEIVNTLQWQSHLETELVRDGYVRISSVQLQPNKLGSSVCLFVFGKLKLVRFIREVFAEQVPVYRHYGGIAIRLRLFDSSIAFVCSHLEVGGHLTVTHRNQNIKKIESRLFVPIHSIDSHDFVFWCGTLNYAIDCTVDRVKQMTIANKWKDIATHDQLKTQMEQNSVLEQYQEGDIIFKPDMLQRGTVPSWPDRIVYKKTNPTRRDEVHTRLNYGKIVFYNRIAPEDDSLHRPLLAEFQIEILRVNGVKRSQVLEKLSPGWAAVERELSSSNWLPLLKQDKLCDINELTNFPAGTTTVDPSRPPVTPTVRVQQSQNRPTSRSPINDHSNSNRRVGTSPVATSLLSKNVPNATLVKSTKQSFSTVKKVSNVCSTPCATQSSTTKADSKSTTTSPPSSLNTKSTTNSIPPSPSECPTNTHPPIAHSSSDASPITEKELTQVSTSVNSIRRRDQLMASSGESSSEVDANRANIATVCTEDYLCPHIYFLLFILCLVAFMVFCNIVL